MSFTKFYTPLLILFALTSDTMVWGKARMRYCKTLSRSVLIAIKAYMPQA